MKTFYITVSLLADMFLSAVMIGVGLTMLAFSIVGAVALATAAPKPPPAQEIQQETPKRVSLLDLPDHVMGSMSVQQQIKTVYATGLVLETVGKVMPKHPITGGFTHSFLRQFGCQLQVSAMHRAGLISNNQWIAAGQGVLVGL